MRQHKGLDTTQHMQQCSMKCSISVNGNHYSQCRAVWHRLQHARSYMRYVVQALGRCVLCHAVRASPLAACWCCCGCRWVVGLWCGCSCAWCLSRCCWC
jgi:hypothetical protein